MQPDTALAITPESASAALRQALEQARSLGFQFAEPTRFTASQRLEKLIHDSEALSQ